MHRIVIVLFISVVFSLSSSAQSGSIQGRVSNLKTNEAIPFATIILLNTGIGATSDIDGNYLIKDVPPGIYNVACSLIGFQTSTSYEVQVTSVKSTNLNFSLEENAKQLNAVEITSDPFVRKEESPLSLQTVGSTEIYRSPGANRDISKVIQILPGVGSSVSFRNDLIVRGGAPNENRFFIDGIEVPNINHFATQGSSGGPVGMINVNFIREVDFYTGAFPANRGNALSSVAEFKFKEGNKDRISGTAMIGSSDFGLTIDGPIGSKSNIIFSYRRSYLQLLFKALALPFLPTYNDLQLKHTIKFDEKRSLTILGLAALDEFSLNKTANDGLKDSATIERNNYILGYLPVNTQWNYTIGAVYKILSRNRSTSFSLSRNHLNNSSIKYRNNSDLPEDKILDYNSSEVENKFRAESTHYKGKFKMNAGIELENAEYTNSTFRRIEYQGRVTEDNVDSRLSFNKFSLFFQGGAKLINEKVLVSAGLRTDFNSYSTEMMNPIKQFSPRVSVSYAVAEKWSLNFNTGRYYQLPPYTVMGYRDSLNVLLNKRNDLRYIRCDQIVSGIEFSPTKFSKISIEGFYKNYSHYPFAIKDSISLANLGGDFGVIGNEAVVSVSTGRSYGLELFARQKLGSSVYGLLSYTFFKSEFRDKNGNYRASSWDNRHILNLVAGKKFRNNWELGIKFRLSGGAPYTPYNLDLSSRKDVWDITYQGVYDWNRLNENRNPVSHSMDVRIDKKWYYKKISFDAYLDIQNIYNFQSRSQAYLDVVKDANGNPLTNPSDPDKYQIYFIENTNGTVLPSIGIMVEF